MQLGDFLKDAPEAPTEPVTFRIVWKNERGAQTAKEVRAVLAFVDAWEAADARREAKRVVSEANKDNDGPPLDFEDETIYHLLYRALRDADDPRRSFADSAIKLRKSIVPSVAAALYGAYNRFLAREFPATVSDRERAELALEAEKNSSSGPA